MATGVQRWSKTAGTNATADTNVNWSEGQAPSSINDSARAEMASVAKWRDDISGTLTTGGSSTAYTLTTNQLFTADAAGMSGAMITFIPHATSGAFPTLAVDGLTARAINQSTGVAVPTGALVLGTPYVVTYIHATTEFILQGALGAATFNDPVQILSTDAGAGVGPTLDLYRNSASPAASDVIGAIDFNGKDSGAAKQTYAEIVAQITDPTTASEDANLLLRAVVGGTLTTILQNNGGALFSTLQMILSNATAALSLSGGATGSRNGSPTAGDTRYNTSLNGLEYWNGTAWIVGGQKPTVQRFLSGSGNYTTPANVLFIKVTMCGPGAGGAAATTNNGTNGTANTSFGSWTAVLGQGGVTSNGAGGIGGTGGTDVADASNKLIDRVSGGVGAGGSTSGTAGVVPFAGSGGNNPRGGAGAGGKSGTAGTNAAANSGGGGGGGGATAGTQGGGGGGAGEWVQFYVYPTAAQVIAYVVGAAGAGGPAGVNAGGNGAAGIIVVEEFYS